MKKLSSEKLFLTELGKFQDKFQFNWTDRTHVMNLLVKYTRFWTDFVKVVITWEKWIIWKKCSK